jgi:MFS family permease
VTSLITDPLRQKLLLAAIALGVVMDGIDGSIVNVALPTMAAYFDTDTGTIAWVIITYLLMMAGLLLVFGKPSVLPPAGSPPRLTFCSLPGSCRDSGLR